MIDIEKLNWNPCKAIKHTFSQRSDEWHNIRIGKITGSTVKRLMPGARTRDKFIFEKASEVLSGQENSNGFQNSHMKRGLDFEQAAIANYELETATDVQTIGFYELNKYVGCSPDGLVNNKIVEIKCRIPAIHFGIIYGNKVPKEDTVQVQFNMWATGSEAADFISYCPDFKPQPLFIVEAEPDKEMWKTFDAVSRGYIADLNQVITQFKAQKEAT